MTKSVARSTRAQWVASSKSVIRGFGGDVPIGHSPSLLRRRILTCSEPYLSNAHMHRLKFIRSRRWSNTDHLFIFLLIQLILDSIFLKYDVLVLWFVIDMSISNISRYYQHSLNVICVISLEVAMYTFFMTNKIYSNTSWIDRWARSLNHSFTAGWQACWLNNLYCYKLNRPARGRTVGMW
jgi:hypothetical protein